jgi:hypothetical protein
MHKIFYLLICALIIICCKARSTNITIKDSAEPQWRTLFDGKSLDNWTTKITGHKAGENYGNTFRVQDSLLSIRYDAYGDDFDNRFGALYFNEIFTNYRLRVEYRFIGETAPGAPEWGFRDSGIQYHAQSPESMAIDQPFPICLEYNLHGGNGTDDRPVGAICANGMKVEIAGLVQDSYCTPPQIPKTFHGDQWVMAEIEVNGDSISHFVNGIKILSFQNPHFNPDHDLGKTFISNGEDLVRSGYISLQSNSHPIDFRKIEIIEF